VRLGVLETPELSVVPAQLAVRQEVLGIELQGAPVEPNALFPIVSGRACEEEVALLLRVVDANGLQQDRSGLLSAVLPVEHVPQDRQRPSAHLERQAAPQAGLGFRQTSLSTVEQRDDFERQAPGGRGGDRP
jgi:hypothetical protein